MSQPPQPTRTRPPKIHLKVWLKIEQIARLRCAGVKDAQIMPMLGISQGCLTRILRLQEYKDTENAMLAGAITKVDEIISLRTDAMKQYFAAAIPVSMRALVDTVLQKRDLKARLEAAKEILNRDPRRTFLVQDAKAGANQGDDLGASLPTGVLDRLGHQSESLVAEASKAELGPSGKPN